MKTQTKMIVAGALALTAGLTLVSGTPASPTAQASAGVDYAPAKAAVQALQGQLEGIDAESWKNNLFKELAVDAAAAAHATVKLAEGESDAAGAARILEMAAFHVDVIVGHVDGQSGDAEATGEDDWIEDVPLTVLLHGLATEARTEIFRARRDS